MGARSPEPEKRASIAAIVLTPSYMFFIPLLMVICTRTYVDADTYKRAIFVAYCLPLAGMALSFYFNRRQIAQHLADLVKNTDWFVLIMVIAPMYAALFVFVLWFVFNYSGHDVDEYYHAGGSLRNLFGIYAAIQMAGFMSLFAVFFLTMKICRWGIKLW